MATRDRYRKQMEPCLEPGEQIEEVFFAQTGPNPRWLFLSTFVMFATRYYIVAVTDRAIIVTRPGQPKKNPSQPTVARLPRELVLGPTKGLWAGPLYLTPDGKKLWVHRRFHRDVNAADERLAASGRQPIGHAGQPPQPGAVPPSGAEVPTPPPPPPPPTGEGTSF